MKLRVDLKDPDGFYDAVQDFAGHDPDRADEVHEALRKWVEYKEYVTIEFDLANGTATVVPLNA